MNKSDYIFGTRVVLEALEAGKSIDKILIRKEIGGEMAKEIISRAKGYEVPVQRVPMERLNRITLKNHQGVIALMSPVRYHKLENLLPGLYEEGKVPFLICLDGLTDMRNFGAIGRTADCAGVDGIVIPDRNSVSVTADAVKTSAGALMYVPVCRQRDLPEAIKFLKECGVTVIGASEKGAVEYTEIDYTVPVAIVMGNEEHGLSDEVLRLCDRLAAIPMAGNIGSLNVSVAAGILMYEVCRQRR